MPGQEEICQAEDCRPAKVNERRPAYIPQDRYQEFLREIRKLYKRSNNVK